MSEKPPDQMTLIFLKDTRQVVAAATRQAVPATAVSTGSETEEQRATNAANELKVLVGDELFVRDLPVVIIPGSSHSTTDVIASGISLPAQDLDVVTLDFKPTLFKEARTFFIDGDKKPQRGLDPSVPATSVTLVATSSKITVTLSALPTENTAVLVWIYRDDRSELPEFVDGLIKKGDPPPKDKSIEMTVPLESGGAYHFLALVQGYRPAFYEQVI